MFDGKNNLSIENHFKMPKGYERKKTSSQRESEEVEERWRGNERK